MALNRGYMPLIIGKYEINRELSTPVDGWKNAASNEKLNKVLTFLHRNGYRLLKDSILTSNIWEEKALLDSRLTSMRDIFAGPLLAEEVYAGEEILALAMTFAPDPVRSGRGPFLSVIPALLTSINKIHQRRWMINVVLTETYLYVFADIEIFTWSRLCAYAFLAHEDSTNIALPDRPETETEDGRALFEAVALLEAVRSPGDPAMPVPVLFRLLSEHELLFDNLAQWRYLEGWNYRILSDEKVYKDLVRDLVAAGYIKVCSLEMWEDYDSDGWLIWRDDPDSYSEWISPSGAFFVRFEKKNMVGQTVTFQNVYEKTAV